MLPNPALSYARGGASLPTVPSLAALRALIRQREERVGMNSVSRDAPARGVNPERALGASDLWGSDLTTQRGVVHEWFSGAASDFPALSILAHLTRTAMKRTHDLCAVWIGAACFATPRLLGDLLARSLFVDPSDDAARLWAIDLALRSPGVSVVIADGKRLDMAASRRLQLAAQARRDEPAHGPLVLIARPARDLTELSAATTRWVVLPAPSSSLRPRWTVQLLRCKGMRPISEEASRCVVEYDHATGALDLSPDVRHGHRTQAAGTLRLADERRTA